MNLPPNLITQAKQAIQSQWSDTVTVTRSQKVGNVVDDIEVYKDIKCHLSKGSLSPLNQTETVATTSSTFTIYVDTDILLLSGDAVVITHKNQAFKGDVGEVFHGDFSNTAKVGVTEIS